MQRKAHTLVIFGIYFSYTSLCRGVYADTLVIFGIYFTCKNHTVTAFLMLVINIQL